MRLLCCLPRFLSSWFVSSWNVKIISAAWKPRSATGRSRAFSTCSSHLTVVLLLFGSVTIACLHPKPNHSTGTDKMPSVSYTAATPVFNTLLYSLRTKDVFAALKKLLLKKTLWRCERSLFNVCLRGRTEIRFNFTLPLFTDSVIIPNYYVVVYYYYAFWGFLSEVSLTTF